MGVVKPLALGACIGVLLSAIGWLVVTQIELRNRLDRQTDRAEALSDQMAELESALGASEATILSLETRLDVLSDQLAEAIPRIEGDALSTACSQAVAGGPALPADWTYVCEADSPDDDTLGIAMPERYFGDERWGGTITIYSAEHLDYGSVGSASFQAELVDTVYHEAHHAWCFRSGGAVDHEGAFDEVPTCNLAVPVGPPVGEWGGGDG
jgi:hypothetical protein